ncbi:MAG: carbohydrate-binding family 9-like protein, partial [Phycisphaeraceae bacterium]
NWVQGTIRYPLPRFSVSLQTADPDGGQMSRRGSLDLPVVGTRPGVTAAVTTAAPTINGAPDERIWRRDPDVPGFAQMRQRRDIEPRTEAWAAWDDEALYLAFRCDEPEVGKLKLDAADRDDNVFQDDSVEIMLDPDGDGDGEGRDYFQIIVSAANVVFDGKGFDNSITLAGLETATAVGKDAWTAEIAIPWESLGLDGPPDHAGILLARNRHVIGKHEVFQFPLSPKGNHQPAMFATLRLSE